MPVHAVKPLRLLFILVKPFVIINISIIAAAVVQSVNIEQQIVLLALAVPHVEVAVRYRNDSVLLAVEDSP